MSETQENQESQAVDAVVDSSVCPEIQEILNEVEEELNKESKTALKKAIAERVKRIRKMKAELEREETALAGLLSMKPAEVAAFNQAALSGSSDHWAWVDAVKYAEAQKNNLRANQARLSSGIGCWT
jgi:beta-glucosidase-like glycosyl hydrolase